MLWRKKNQQEQQTKQRVEKTDIKLLTCLLLDSESLPLGKCLKNSYHQLG